MSTTDHPALVELSLPPTFDEILTESNLRAPLIPVAAPPVAAVATETVATERPKRNEVEITTEGLNRLLTYMDVFHPADVTPISEMETAAPEHAENALQRDLVGERLGSPPDAATAERLLEIIQEMRLTAHKVAAAHDFSPIARRRLLVLLGEMEEMVAVEQSA